MAVDRKRIRAMWMRCIFSKEVIAERLNCSLRTVNRAISDIDPALLAGRESYEDFSEDEEKALWFIANVVDKWSLRQIAYAYGSNVETIRQGIIEHSKRLKEIEDEQGNCGPAKASA